MARGKNKKPRAERRAAKTKVDREALEEEQREIEIIDALHCPRDTAAYAYEVGLEQVGLAVRAFKFLNTADYVWRERPELNGPMMELRAQLEAHLQAILPLVTRFETLAAAEEDHEDLTEEELFARLAPMFDAQEAREAAAADDDPSG